MKSLYESFREAGLFEPATLKRKLNYFEYLDRFMSPKGKRVLDIGGGNGAFTFWNASRGASSVLCLEPFISDEGARKFGVVARAMECDNVELRKITIQDFESPNGAFDSVLFHNSVNHINEEMCMVLHKEQAAREVYTNVFRKVAAMTAAGGDIAIMDCARSNFFPKTGLPNPFSRAIEWDKHQDPDLWISLLKDAGFVDPVVRWKLPHAGALNPLVFAISNRATAFFYLSYFMLTMKKA